MSTPDTSNSPGGDAGPAKTPWSSRIRQHLVIISLYLTLFLSALDVTIVAPARPIIASHLSATTSQYTWVGSAYTLASTSTTPLWAKISDIWGRKPILMMTNFVFLVGSLVCALSVSPMMHIGGRVIQGVGGGGIIVMVTIIIEDIFTLRERAKYYALTGIVWAIASGVGPILGGVFTQATGWEWCFYINLPFDGITLFLLFFFMHLPLPTTPPIPLSTLRTFDFPGSALIIAGTVTFLYGLESGSSDAHAWNSTHTLGLLLGRVHSLRMLPPCLLTATLHSFTFIPYTYFNPLYFQSILSVTPIQSGAYVFALVLPLSAMTMGSGLYVRKTGSYRPVIWTAGAVMLTGTALFIDFRPRLQLHKIILYQLVAGLGVGPLFQAPMIAFQSRLDAEMLAAGNAALAFLKSLATSLSLVVGGVVLQGVAGDGLSLPQSQSQPRAGAGEEVEGEVMRGLRGMWVFYTVVCAMMWTSSFGIQRRDLDGRVSGEGERNGKGENESTQG
ncbi:major facilitator superfamily domain-containing protein [Aspergillus aurantiobrunneus]